MLSKTFTSGRIRRADYNPESQQLDLHWEDRIAEEYPKGVPMTSTAVLTGTKTLNDLFGPEA